MLVNAFLFAVGVAFVVVAWRLRVGIVVRILLGSAGVAIALLAAFGGTVVAPLADNHVEISREEFGHEWPFTVDEGILEGRGTGGVGEVTFTTGGKTYAVNGTAKDNPRYADIDEIWADDPVSAGLKIDMGPVIDRGLRLCR